MNPRSVALGLDYTASELARSQDLRLQGDEPQGDCTGTEGA